MSAALRQSSLNVLDEPLVLETRDRPIASPSDDVAAGLPGVDDLKELMRSVSETTQRLQATHIALREQVSRLQGELAQANSQLRRSRSLAALGEMAAGIAHEVRNPLGSIQLYVQVLAEDLADRPEQAKLCHKIDRAVVGLDAIVRDVLQFARDMKISPAPTAAGDLIDRALAVCDGLLCSADVALTAPNATAKQVRAGVPSARTTAGGTPALPCLPDSPLPIELRADVGLITQALGNVIRNAVEAMALIEPPEGERHELAVSASVRQVRCPDGKTRRRVVFTIDDTGGGIAPDVLKRMFNPFFTTRKTGTGLGLAIVHRIVDAHGGHINVRNRQPRGTRFELCLPECAGSAGVPPARDAAARVGPGGTHARNHAGGTPALPEFSGVGSGGD